MESNFVIHRTHGTNRGDTEKARRPHFEAISYPCTRGATLSLPETAQCSIHFGLVYNIKVDK